MAHLLLTDREAEVAYTLDLNQPDDRNRLRSLFDHAAHSGERAVERIYVIDPEINDGVPTRCRTRQTQSRFDNDDYADAQVMIYAPQAGYTNGGPIVHRFGYRIDGRS